MPMPLTPAGTKIAAPLLRRKTAIRINPESTGCLLPDFVAARFTYRSREEWRQEIDVGHFLLNGGRPTHQSVLTTGDLLEYLLPELQEPPVDQNFAVLYEDDDILVVDKPAQLPCHPGGRFFRHTLWALLQEKYGLRRPSLINRLDRETSGIVLVAKHKQAARRCCRQFAARQAHKSYLVLVEGRIPFSVLRADGFLVPDQTSTIRKKVRFFPADAAAVPAGSIPCSTIFRMQGSGGNITLLAAEPLTGRTHQIRATLCSLGFPVVGDKLYGVDEELFLRFQRGRLTPGDHFLLRMERQALHAASLRIRHPIKGHELCFVSPLPPAMRFLLETVNVSDSINKAALSSIPAEII